MNPGGVLVELDALLDTRLGTIAMLDGEAALKLLNNRKYYERLNDHFEELTGIPQAEYEGSFKTRNADTAAASIMTWIPFLMAQLMRFSEIEQDTTPLLENVRLIVNIYPYVFTDEELDDLRLVFKHYSSMNVLPEIVSMKPEEVTPAWIKHNLAGMILYNSRPWLEAHLSNMRPGQLHEVTLLMPSLFALNDKELEEKFLAELPSGLSPMRATEIFVGGYIYTRILPTYLFSIYRPDIYGEKHLPEEETPQPSEKPVENEM